MSDMILPSIIDTGYPQPPSFLSRLSFDHLFNLNVFSYFRKNPNFEQEEKEKILINDFLSLIVTKASVSQDFLQWVQNFLSFSQGNVSPEELKQKIDPELLSRQIGSFNAKLLIARGYELASIFTGTRTVEGDRKKAETAMEVFESSFKSICKDSSLKKELDDIRLMMFHANDVSPVFFAEIAQAARQEFLRKVALYSKCAVGTIFGAAAFYLLYTKLFSEASIEALKEIGSTIQSENLKNTLSSIIEEPPTCPAIEGIEDQGVSYTLNGLAEAAKGLSKIPEMVGKIPAMVSESVANVSSAIFKQTAKEGLAGQSTVTTEFFKTPYLTYPNQSLVDPTLVMGNPPVNEHSYLYRVLSGNGYRINDTPVLDIGTSTNLPNTLRVFSTHHETSSVSAPQNPSHFVDTVRDIGKHPAVISSLSLLGLGSFMLCWNVFRKQNEPVETVDNEGYNESQPTENPVQLSNQNLNSVLPTLSTSPAHSNLDIQSRKNSGSIIPNSETYGGSVSTTPLPTEPIGLEALKGLSNETKMIILQGFKRYIEMSSQKSTFNIDNLRQESQEETVGKILEKITNNPSIDKEAVYQILVSLEGECDGTSYFKALQRLISSCEFFKNELFKNELIKAGSKIKILKSPIYLTEGVELSPAHLSSILVQQKPQIILDFRKSLDNNSDLEKLFSMVLDVLSSFSNIPQKEVARVFAPCLIGGLSHEELSSASLILESMIDNPKPLETRRRSSSWSPLPHEFHSSHHRLDETIQTSVSNEKQNQLMDEFVKFFTAPESSQQLTDDIYKSSERTPIDLLNRALQEAVPTPFEYIRTRTLKNGFFDVFLELIKLPSMFNKSQKALLALGRQATGLVQCEGEYLSNRPSPPATPVKVSLLLPSASSSPLTLSRKVVIKDSPLRILDPITPAKQLLAGQNDHSKEEFVKETPLSTEEINQCKRKLIKIFNKDIVNSFFGLDRMNLQKLVNIICGMYENLNKTNDDQAAFDFFNRFIERIASSMVSNNNQTEMNQNTIFHISNLLWLLAERNEVYFSPKRAESPYLNNHFVPIQFPFLTSNPHQLKLLET